MQKQQKQSIGVLILFCLLVGSELLSSSHIVGHITGQAAAAQQIAQEVAKPSSFVTLNYLTGWTHDSGGYHPAIFVLLENNSNRDLSNRAIKFQGRFTDLDTSEVTIGRNEIRRELNPRQRFNLTIQGVQGRELPMEADMWPKIEAKIMCKIGTSGDELPETILITRVDQIARAEDDAVRALNQASGFNSNHHVSTATAGTGRSRWQAANRPRELTFQRRPEPEKPLPLKYIPATSSYARPAKITATFNGDHNNSQSELTILTKKILPPLGSDFYDLEQHFGLPLTTDASHSDWSFAKYHHNPSGTEILAGARHHSSKVDLLILKIPRQQANDGLAVVNAARQFISPAKPALPTPTKSVRYLPSGRIELIISSTANRKIICLTPQSPGQADNSFILIMSRLPQELEPMLAGLSRRSTLLSLVRCLDQAADINNN